MATITAEVRDVLVGIYVGMFKAAPGATNLSSMVQQYESGMTQKQIAASLASTANFSTVYPGYMLNTEFADQLVNNLLGNLVSASDKAWATNWVLLKVNSGVSKSDTITMAVNALKTATNAAYGDAKAQLNNQIEVAKYYSITENQSSTDLATLQDVIAGVTQLAATVTAAKANIDTDIALAASVVFNLTANADDIIITKLNTIDTVKGFFDGTDDTFSTNDNIQGNGLTKLQLVVDGSGSADYVEMSGIDSISLVGAGNYTFTLDASTYGTDVSTVTMSGSDSMDVRIDDLAVEGTLTASVANASESYIEILGTIDDASLYVELDNSDASDGVGTVAVVGAAGITLTAGKNDVVQVSVSHSESTSAATVSVGDISVGDITSNIGASASATVYLQNYANNTKATGNAVAGSVTVGNVAINADDTSAYGYVEIYNSADAQQTKGTATAGSVTVGNVTIDVGLSGSATLAVDNSADAYIGAAKAGNITLGNVTLTAATSASVSVSLENLATVSTSGAATVGNTTVGNVSLVVGVDASGTFTVSNYAYSAKGAATVGSVVIGNVDISLAKSATAEFTVNNSATADNGAATVGNLTIGNVSVTTAGSATGLTFYLYNSAQATKGNATAGNITMGDISVTAGDESSYPFYGYVYNMAEATTTGNAKVGNITVGDIDVVLGDDLNNYGFTASFSNWASADKGTATAGNITIGDVNMAAGNTGGTDVYLGVYNRVDVSLTGAATVGNVTIGDIEQVVGSSNDAYVYISSTADAAKGKATVGSVSVGDLSGNVTLDGYLWHEIDVRASGTVASGDAVGNVSVGDINYYGQPGADVNFSMNINSVKGSVGTVTIGDVEMSVDATGSVDLSLDVIASTTIGNVTVGDITFNLGTSATIDTFSVELTAGKSIGNVTFGDITINGGINSSDSSAAFDVVAGTTLGNITIGDITVNAAKDAAFDSLTMDFTAGKTIGNINIGDVTLSAAESGYIWDAHNFTATGAIGTITYGDIAVSAGKEGYAGFSIEADANANAIGLSTFGDVTLTATGQSATVDASIWLSDTGDTPALATVGDINISVTNTAAANAGANAQFSMNSKGSITVGDISVTAGDATTSFVASATVDADVVLTTGNNLIVGNITVVGGDVHTGSVVNDSFATLSNWLSLTETGSGSITIGNVDYSGYTAASTIDVSAIKGAAVIKAGTAGSTISDNLTKNVIHLGAGADTIVMLEGMTTDETAAGNLDSIVNFASGVDAIAIDTTSNASDFAFVSSAAASYSAFLTAATSAMFNDGKDIYARVVGGNTYVAFDKDNGGAVDFVIELVGITSVSAGDFSIS